MNSNPPSWFFNILLTAFGAAATIVGMFIWRDISDIKEDNKKILSELATVTVKVQSLEEDNKRLTEKVFPVTSPFSAYPDRSQPIRKRKRSTATSQIILFKQEDDYDSTKRKNKPWLS